MAESFTLTILYKGEQKHFEAALWLIGYTHKIAVQIGEKEVFFEPDEERNYRAVVADPQNTRDHHDRQLLQAIAEGLEETFK